ncbi:hypothetical protein ACFO5X_24290 [Seohaeicola nanhaiensis]|uniref:Uncharacterized protein n=1 Tax=Seohaeicola nanhaiensis TaxID=1387282 RepID=A0ABV9KP09_9RHOB
MRAENTNPGALAGATGADFKADGLRDQNTSITYQIKSLIFYQSEGGSVERLDLREVAA